MTHLIIVRHAESEHNIQNRIQGHQDSRLSAKGLRQAKRLARRLKNFHIDKIYTSDLGRAYATTFEIARHRTGGQARHTKAPVIRDPYLREIQLGDWEGMTPEEVNGLYNKGYQRWLKKPSACFIPKAERVGHFRKRVTERVRAIAQANRKKTVLIVTHGGVITALLADWLKADFDHLLLNLQIDNTSLTVVEQTEKRTRLHAVNDTSHLSNRERNDHSTFIKRT